MTMDADATAIPVAELRSDSSQSDASGSRRPAGGGDGAILSEYHYFGTLLWHLIKMTVFACNISVRRAVCNPYVTHVNNVHVS